MVSGYQIFGEVVSFNQHDPDDVTHCPHQGAYKRIFLLTQKRTISVAPSAI